MKNIIYLLGCIFLISCEDVIDLNLNTADPRLVIDASLLWKKNTTGSTQFIQLTLTTGYYDAGVPAATGATVTVTDGNNNLYNFIEESDTGIYRNDVFVPVMNSTYTLKIIYNNEIYTGTETMIPVVVIDKVEQNNNAGFSGEETEIKAFYTDPKDVENFYFFEFINSEADEITLNAYEDSFTDGNQIFAFYSNEDIKPGDELLIRNHGISKRFYEYMNLLLQQTGAANGSFETRPAILRGNCINETNPNNFPFGYFRASEVSEINYTLQ